MPGIMESTLHVCGSLEMWFDFVFELFKYDFFSSLSGSEFQSFGL